jgi:hypothetical protein
MVLSRKIIRACEELVNRYYHLAGCAAFFSDKAYDTTGNSHIETPEVRYHHLPSYIVLSL